MDGKKIREAVEYFTEEKVFWNQHGVSKEQIKNMCILTDLAEAYLSIEGFPEKENKESNLETCKKYDICFDGNSYDAGYKDGFSKGKDTTIDQYKLAMLKSEKQELDVDAVFNFLLKINYPDGFPIKPNYMGGGSLKNCYPSIFKSAQAICQEFKLQQQITRSDFHSILCEHMPSIAEDSGQAEWCKSELDEAYDDVILGKGIWSSINGRDTGFKAPERVLPSKEELDACVYAYHALRSFECPPSDYHLKRGHDALKKIMDKHNLY